MIRVSGNGVDCEDSLSCLAEEGDIEIVSAPRDAASASCPAERAAEALLIGSRMREAERDGCMAAPKK